MRKDCPITAAITAEDARRFRMATLRAKLTRLGMSYEADAGEETLEKLVQFAERRKRERIAAAARGPARGNGE